ncbi:uncharacterized protein LOC108674589 [Hyalella azteca]|uniref:Uncharacterized protein LOC108674589 n=1 Tax=Hyalella azteca TaxID=294128 RepID=A0A8B7NWD8_HYAAZ|nr:uncharacterized protein LOC108674589 [Hyalella azteca]
MSTEELIERLAGAERSSLQATVRGMLKLMITKDVALRFSFTGMDCRRQKTKESFKNHAAYERIMVALKQTRFDSARRPEVNRAIMNALKNVPDWEGGRDHRVRRRVPLRRNESSSTSTIEMQENAENSNRISATLRRSPRQHNATPIHSVFSKAVRLLEL